ncbi:NAD-dependent succinate-semialdehyde dehydrogenase [Peribacillus cavernae]|uniref:NAD-dependent succinate-semialdehyde dehydrogenase n=1 Tax=Peribacillus cavernae TaxID=1674310 RepID=A0A3S1B5Q3_9BACI|nr:NAD-dependent succinate-semialdehyde dehydrogenase [Peribacillus cavernae]MDQ0221153.1 succinate-semialdehyde dehydrogenase/glutarate-semialdehyde dehydrogenase [Peribacillus cavernae]RUQ29081.1 NAD-dependent succinate-semialdehyde dehydrogenase [Peribacillus cavernae]
MLKVDSLVNLTELKMYVNGEWTDAQEGKTFSVTNPSTGKIVAHVPKGGRYETQQAIEAAGQAFKSWSKLTANERGKYLLKLRDLMHEYKDELAEIMSLEMGKPFTEAQGEVIFAASYFEWYAEEGRRIYGETIPASSPDKRLMVIRQPIGVVAAITPWNFPLAMMTRKIGPAMAAGCTGILKPAKQSPISALAFGKLVEMAGIPHGVVNVVTGDSGPISDEIFENPIVKKISFTGSTEVGKLLVTKSAPQLKRLSLELGGHAPFIVFEDADLEAAASGAIASKFRNTGQTCVCANRIYVQRSVIEKFSKLFVEKAQALKVGNSIDPSVDVGPLVSRDGLEKVEEHVHDALSKGAQLLCGGKRLEGELADGLFYEPTILAEVTADMLITNEETFGPVAPIIPFDTEEEVLQYANDTVYGLAAYFYTENASRSVRVSEALEFGIIGMNDAIPTVAQAPFGGIKESGMGREGGHQGMDDYLEDKYISMKFQTI